MPQSISRFRPPIVPASFFGIVLGLAGLANSWRVAHRTWGLPAEIGETIFVAAGLSWLVITVLYLWKWVAAPELVREEANHAVQCCFIGLSGVSTLMISLGALPYSRSLSIGLFVIGEAVTVLFALWRTGLLWRGKRETAATTPILYFPTVAGGFVSALVAAALGWTELGQLVFGMALFSWFAIESVLLHRLYTGDPMPPALRPTLGIQLAPPAVGSVAYLAIGGGQPDLMSHALIGYALLQAFILIRMSRWIMEQPFGASYWAFTFGAAALAGACVRLAPASQGGAIAILAPVLFVGANLLVLAIALGTLWLLVQGRLLPNPVPAK